MSLTWGSGSGKPGKFWISSWLPSTTFTKILNFEEEKVAFARNLAINLEFSNNNINFTLRRSLGWRALKGLSLLAGRSATSAMWVNVNVSPTVIPRLIGSNLERRWPFSCSFHVSLPPVSELGFLHPLSLIRFRPRKDSCNNLENETSKSQVAQENPTSYTKESKNIIVLFPPITFHFISDNG